MGNFPTAVKFSAALLYTCLLDYVRTENLTQVAECVESMDGCRRCRGGICARCAVLLHQGSCVDACPAGHTADWSTRDEYMGRICKENGYIFGLTGSQVAILVGVASGATICIFIVLCGAFVLHRRKRTAAKLARQYEDSAERKEFLKHLATLRGEANTFLSMLNDTRRQVRELYYSGSNGDGAVGIQAYRPVLRDLARILVLVNRRDEEIPVPPDDWQRLFSWAERLLRRYKRHSSPEVAQLVTFLQQPTAAGEIAPVQANSAEQIKIPQLSQSYDSRTTPTNLTTFQANIPLATFQASDKSSISPPGSSIGGYIKDSPTSSRLDQNSKVSRNGSIVGQMTPLVYGNKNRASSRSSTNVEESAASAFNYNYNFEESWLAATNSRILKDNENVSGLDQDINPKWEFPSAVEAANYSIVSDWSPGRDYFIDDFTILGFRPQDEITTEL